jgi:hypothetical protein
VLSERYDASTPTTIHKRIYVHVENILIHVE